MIIAILALLGVPLWLCAILLLVIVVRNRKLRKRHGDIPVRVKRPGKQRWTRGHAIWVSEVFAWRGSPGVWSEELVRVLGVTLRNPDAEERTKLRYLGDGFPIATLFIAEGETLEVAAGPERHSRYDPRAAPEARPQNHGRRQAGRQEIGQVREAVVELG